MTFQLFIDFDGTIAEEDVGHQLFLRFAEAEVYLDLEERWLKDSLSSVELYEQICPHTRVTPAEFRGFLAGQRLDPHFSAFVAASRRAGDSLLVLSDGFRQYIEPLLSGAGIEALPIYANEFEFSGDGQIVANYPFAAHTCGRCANCKGWQVRRLRQPGKTTVFVGDGNSDRCGAVVCDVVFAKNRLASFFERERLNYYPFNDFADVQKQLEILRRAGQNAGEA